VTDSDARINSSISKLGFSGRARAGDGEMTIKPLYEFSQETRQLIFKMHLEIRRGGNGAD
jgi:hypothetical protein